MSDQSSPRVLTKGKKVTVAVAAGLMVVAGGIGGFGTYTNLKDAFGGERRATAMGVVAAGEGATAILALTMLCLTMLGQSSPLPVRVGLWALPILASGTGVTVATTVTETVVYAVTPLAMVVAAEGLGLLARRVVIYRDGRDVEAEARAASVVRSLAYHRARTASHPNKRVRERSERRSWRLARRLGDGDPTLASGLLTVQRTRLQSGADDALSAMFGQTTTSTAAPTEPVPEPAESPGTDTEESTEKPAKRSHPDQAEQPAEAAIESAPTDTDSSPVVVLESAPDPDPADGDESAGRPEPALPVVAAAPPRPRRVSATVPPTARASSRRRSWEELVAEARSITADWPDSELTANAVRKAVRTSAENARRLRDALRAARANEAGAEEGSA